MHLDSAHRFSCWQSLRWKGLCLTPMWLCTALDTPWVAHADAPSAHLCTPAEAVVFACQPKGKVVSVCASRDAGARSGQLSYRFGPDAASPPELTLPDKATPPSQAASGQTEAFSGGGGAWLRFARGGYTYTVYTGIGRWGPQGQTQEKQGVVVQRQGKTLAHLPCPAPATSELAPDWYERMGITVRADEAFAFP